MIGKISGRLDWRGSDTVLIDVRGVGYIVHVNERTMASLPGVGEAVSLYTDLLVREDLLQLFGFPTMLEKEWHKLLMTVQGVGAKASMAILGALGAEGVARAISLGDATAPGAARLAELGASAKAGQIACVFAEQQHDPALAAQLDRVAPAGATKKALVVGTASVALGAQSHAIVPVVASRGHSGWRVPGIGPSVVASVAPAPRTRPKSMSRTVGVWSTRNRWSNWFGIGSV